MPNILRTVHNWSGYATTHTTTTLRPRMLAKREVDGTGLIVFIVLGIMAAAVVLGLIIRCVRRLHGRQYARSGGKARWSAHHRPQHSHRPTRTNRNADLESGYEMPQYPPPSFHSKSARSHATRSNRNRPSQTVQQFLQSQAGSASARGGAPSARGYYSGR